jgi:hypothetical protein
MGARTLLKSGLWAALFAAGCALAQEAAINGTDFTGGKADAQLGAIGRQAAASGKTVVITAPAYWQAKAAAKIRAGAHGKPVTIRFSNGFYENVLVRIEAPASKAEAAAKPQAKPEPRMAAQVEAKPKAQTSRRPETAEAEPKPQSKPIAPVRKPVAAPIASQAPGQKPVAAVPFSEPPQRANVVAVPQVAHQPAVVPIPTSAADATGLQSALPEQPGFIARQRLLAALNGGRPAAGELGEAQLQSGDQIYSDDDMLAVVRLEGLQRSLYWLVGPVDLRRVQYQPQGNGRYQVTGAIDTRISAVHRSDGQTARRVIARVPAGNDAMRAQLERQYNGGQPIVGSLLAAQLQPEDRLLVDGSIVLVARREGNLMARYWLDGSIDLGQTGVQKVAANLYQVTGSVH